MKKARPSISSVFRDRGGSNRIPDRPRSRGSVVDANKHLFSSLGDSATFSGDHPSSGDETADTLVIVLNFLA